MIIKKVYDTLRVGLTADDEEPKCIRCIGHSIDDRFCAKCGPEYGWSGYLRYIEFDGEALKILKELADLKDKITFDEDFFLTLT